MMDTLTQMGVWLSDSLIAGFVSPWSRNGILALVVGWWVGAFAYRHYFKDEPFTWRGYLRHAFPARIYRSRSFLLDLQISLFDMLLTPMRWVAVIVSSTIAAQALAGGLTSVLGPLRHEPLGTFGTCALAIMLLLAFDLGTYITHRLSHQVPALWAFHRVHHSAEELNPLTLNRKHPVYNVLSIVVDCATVAPLQALVLYGFGAETSTLALGMANAGFVIFAYCAASLRHSHIWLSYGPVLDRIAVSPALHQIHHSRAPRHFDRNYGEVLAIWDWMFGTLYLPREREELTFGLGDEDRQPHPSFTAAMIEPFGYAWRALRPARRGAEAPPVPAPDIQP